MLLDNEPKPVGQNINLDIPPPEKAAEFLPETPPPAQVVEQPASVVSEQVAVPMPPAPEPTVAEAPPPVEPAPITVAPKPVVVIPPVTRESATESPSNTTRYLLHVGNYSNPAKAAQVAERIKANNLKITTEKSGNLTRIRVGPFTDRSQADKARQLLQKQGTLSTLMILK
jgi:DedD protein